MWPGRVISSLIPVKSGITSSFVSNAPVRVSFSPCLPFLSLLLSAFRPQLSATFADIEAIVTPKDHQSLARRFNSATRKRASSCTVRSTFFFTLGYVKMKEPEREGGRGNSEGAREKFRREENQGRDLYRNARLQSLRSLKSFESLPSMQSLQIAQSPHFWIDCPSLAMQDF